MNQRMIRQAAALMCAFAILPSRALTPALATATSHVFPSSVVATADFDADGHADIVLVDPVTNECSILLNNGSNNFTVRDPINLTVGKRPSDAVTADFNLDGFPDLAVACEGSGAVYIYLNSATTPGTFTSSTVTCPAPSRLTAGRLSLDPDPDLAVASTSNNSLSILRNQGDGSFIALLPITNAGGTDGVIVAVDIGDLDNDKDLEEVAIISGIESASPAQGRVISYFLDIDVDPTDPVIINAAYTTTLPEGYEPVDAVLHDFDSDANGLYDLAVAATGSNAILYLVNRGPDPINDSWLGFDTPQTYGPLDDAPAALSAGLLPPPDSLADIAVVLPSVSQVLILTNTGSSSPRFSLGSPFPAPSGGAIDVASLGENANADIILPGGFISY